MKKSDVQFHSDGYGRERRPAVNVKVSFPNAHSLALQVAKGAGRDANEALRFADWWERAGWDGKLPEWLFDAACASGWESLQADAAEIFANVGAGKIEVLSEGRSGGWAVVEGLPPFESWDARMLGRWRKFARWACEHADGIPYDMCSLALLNIWQPAEDQQRKQAAAQAIANLGWWDAPSCPC